MIPVVQRTLLDEFMLYKAFKKQPLTTIIAVILLPIEVPFMFAGVMCGLLYAAFRFGFYEAIKWDEE